MLAAPLILAASDAESPWLQLLARLHPVLVHFPIALILSALLLESCRLLRRRHNPSPAALTCLGLGALAAGPAIAAGWFNADIEPHAASSTMEWHRWLAIAASSLAALAWLLGHAARRFQSWQARRAYVLFLAVAASALAVAGHLGGSLVYGDDYLTQPLQRLFRAPPPAADARPGFTRTPPPAATLTIDFAADVAPILTERCVECHGPTKAKRKLRLDRPELIFRGPPEDWVVQPGRPGDSILLRLIRLPADNDDRMPPEGDPLTPDEIRAIELWIAEGAYFRESAAVPATPEPNAKPAPVRVISPPGPSPATPPAPSPAAPPASEDDAIRALRDLGSTIEPLAEGSTLLYANLSRVSADNAPRALRALASVPDRIASLDLTGLPLSPDDTAHLAARRALVSLVLARTPIADSALADLARLPTLEVLNLVETSISDAAIDALAAMPALRRVYLWQSRVTAEGIARLAKLRPTLEAVREP